LLATSFFLGGSLVPPLSLAFVQVNWGRLDITK